MHHEKRALRKLRLRVGGQPQMLRRSSGGESRRCSKLLTALIRSA
jgi:hypothetical protein